MGFRKPEQLKVSSDAYISVSKHTGAIDVWDQINQALEDSTHYGYQEGEITLNEYIDGRVYKITVIVEEQ